MRRAAISLLLAAAVLSGCRAEPSSGRPTAEDEAQIRAVLEQQEQAWNRGDIQAFMQGYHRRPDVVFTSGGKIRRGWDETLAAYEKKYVAGDAMGRLALTDVELQPVGEGGMVALGHFRVTESPQATEGVFTLVFAKDEQGRWGIVHDHSSAAEP